MKRLLWIFLVIPFLLILAWRLWSPADLSSCASSPQTTGPLMTFIHDYFERNGRVDWHELDNRFDVLSTPEGQKFAGQPQKYACEAIQILQSPTFTSSEKFYTSALMLQLPINQYLGFMDRSHQLFAESRSAIWALLVRLPRRRLLTQKF